MNFNFLKLKWTNGIATLILLLSPILTETIQVPTGTLILERYSPLQLIFNYALQGEYDGILLMIIYSLFIYAAVSAVIKIITSMIIRRKELFTSHPKQEKKQ